MIKVIVKLAEFGEEDYNQYQNIAAFLKMGEAMFLLDSEPLDNEDEKDLEVMEDFCARFEILCNENDMKIEFDPEIDELVEEINSQIEE